MLTQKQIEEIRAYLKKSENPLFFFDDDPDGLCSYLILKKYIDKGHGVVLKTKPILDLDLYRKVTEYSPDFVFILDIPVVTQDFIDKINVPIIWLDHHQPLERKGVHYYNPMLNNPQDNRPTTYWSYKIAEEKFLWLATLGTLSDWHYPEFIPEFIKQYPHLLHKKIKSADQAIFDSKFGELIILFLLLLKGPTSKVHRMANLLTKIEDPNELLAQETARSKFIYRETEKIRKEYDILLSKILSQKPTKDKFFLVYLPPTKNAYTSVISNLMIYKYPSKIIMIIRQNEDSVVMSIRSVNVNLPPILANALDGLEGHGGGHDHACGAIIKKDQFDEFLERFKEQIK